MKFRTDIERLAFAEKCFTEAREVLMGINLRHYRGRPDERAAIQEARNSADCGIDWCQESQSLGEHHVIDLRDPSFARAS